MQPRKSRFVPQLPQFTGPSASTKSITAEAGPSVIRSVTRFLSDRKVTAMTTNFRFFAAVASVCLSATVAQAVENHKLVARTAGEFRVKSVMEVRGELKVNPDGKQVTKMPLKVRGEAVYAERNLSVDAAAGTQRDARLYESASAKVQVGDTNRETTLRPDHHLVIVDVSSEASRLFSPTGPLSRDELELLDIQGNSALLDQLTPGQEIAIGEGWDHSDQLMGELLGLDVVHTNSTRSTLRKVAKNLAVIDLEGEVSGAVGGVSSDVELKAVYNFSLQDQRVTWFAATLQEDRAVGHAEPGFTVTARIRLAKTHSEPQAAISDQALAGLELGPQPGATLLEFVSAEGGFRFLHDRQWWLMVDRHDVSIMRRIERGDLIAQCNISALSDLKPGQHPALEAFQADVKRALGKKFGEFLEASQSVDPSGVRQLRAVVAGTVSELPIQWNYYHFSDLSGRQLALVFTMDAKLVERFAASDAAIISSFAFQSRPEPAAAARQARRESR